MGKRKGKRRWRPLSAHEQEMLMRREQQGAEWRRSYLDHERRLRRQQVKRVFMWKLVGVAVGGVLAGVMHALGRI
ncbi:hypothetical protein GCM10022403_038870 [Streptomyces coacervatus]|uniref:Uncharacterized protein n=1 Tax=Streptomyces coacervatus TaxID=647381 RepID=A0ABP7HSY6_9ACTN